MGSEPSLAEPRPSVVGIGTFSVERRLAESIALALLGSTSLYLVGSVYVTAYYGRLSIDAASLDLAPPAVALQATHALQGLLNYPITIVVIVVLARLFAGPTRWLLRGYAAAAQRFGPWVLLLANLALILPLVVPAVQAAVDVENLVVTDSLVGEVGEVLVTVGIGLVGYVIWLSFGPRQSLVSAVRQRRWSAIGLVFVAYLLNALVTTAQAGEAAAEAFLLGQADDSLALVVTPRPGFPVVQPARPLLLVIERNGFFYAVEQQAPPASGRPITYQIPADGVSLVTTQRLTSADVVFDASDFDGLASPVAP